MVAVFRGARITDALIRPPPTFRCVWTGSLTRAYVAEVLCNGKALASGRIGSDCGNNVLKVLRAEIVPSCDFVVTLWGQARLPSSAILTDQTEPLSYGSREKPSDYRAHRPIAGNRIHDDPWLIRTPPKIRSAGTIRLRLNSASASGRPKRGADLGASRPFDFEMLKEQFINRG